jgi:NAD(P)-dependent dehydrogenase (short-subunit alcohol dehydrogenase family)
MSLCADRVCIVTGAGRGIGRQHALTLAAHGAKVVVNDIGAGVDGSGSSSEPAQQVVEEIEAAGGTAVVNGDDVASWAGADALIRRAIDTFGDLHVLINNAGILRDGMIVSLQEADWDAVMRVHLKGTFAPTHFAAAYWRERSKAGQPVDARIINTSSASGIYGNPSQSNYGAAKAGIAALTVIASRELGRYGVTVNAISPAALTRMTEESSANWGMTREELVEKMSPRWASAVVAWLASSDSAGLTGRVIDVNGQHLAIAEGWNIGPKFDPSDDPEQVGALIAQAAAAARPNANLMGETVARV